MNGRIVTFGEVMLRLKSPGYERLLQSPILEATFGGGEANVAVSLAQFGLEVAFVTVLPQNPSARPASHSCGAGGGYEPDPPQRRAHGAYYPGSRRRPEAIQGHLRSLPFGHHGALTRGVRLGKDLLQGAGWFHVTGITPALSGHAPGISLEAMKTAHKQGLTVSCDYNYRKNLWKYGKTAPEVMTELVRLADVGIANEEDCQLRPGDHGECGRWEQELDDGQIDAEGYQRAVREGPRRLSESEDPGHHLARESSAPTATAGQPACTTGKEFLVSTRYEVTRHRGPGRHRGRLRRGLDLRLCAAACRTARRWSSPPRPPA